MTDNELTGSIPDTLYSLTSLTELRLGDNQLSGTVSDQLSNFDNLGKNYVERWSITFKLGTNRHVT